MRNYGSPEKKMTVYEIVENELENGPAPKEKLAKALEENGIKMTFHNALGQCRKNGLDVRYSPGQGYILNTLPPGVIKLGRSYHCRLSNGKLSPPFATKNEALKKLKEEWQL